MLKYISLAGSYWIALIVLVMWSTFAYMTMHSLIDSQQQYETLINLSGKQRMLSQKTALHAHLITEQRDITATLIPLLRTMKQNHRFIVEHLTSDQTRDYYLSDKGLDSQVKVYFEMLDSFVFQPEKSKSVEIIRYSFELLGKLDTAVSLFEDENTMVVNKLKDREFYIYIGTLMTLLLEAVIIIFPMIRMQKRYIGELGTGDHGSNPRYPYFCQYF